MTMTTDTTPAALERIMERLREPQSERDMAAAQREAAAVIAALGAELGLTQRALDTMNAASVTHDADIDKARSRATQAEAKLREIAGIADSTIRAHTSGSDACHRILTIARTVGEKDNG